MSLWVDGERQPALQVGARDPAWSLGWSVFETLLVQRGQARALPAHLTRLQGSARLLALPPPPLASFTADVATALAGGPALARLRLTWVPPRRVVTLAPLEPHDRGRERRVVAQVWPRSPWAAAKHGSRGPWMAAVRTSGADDVLLCDADGAIRESTMAAVLAVLDGAVLTAPEDGAQLASIGLAAVLAAAEGAGVEVRRERPRVEQDLDGLYLVSALRGIEPIVALDGVAQPGWEPVGRRLAAIIG